MKSHGTSKQYTGDDETVKDPNRDACLTADGEMYSPSQINAFVLGKMKETAEAHQSSVQQAAVTAALHCRHAQRQATKDAGKLSGLVVLRIINEPTAAALTSRLESKDGQLCSLSDIPPRIQLRRVLRNMRDPSLSIV